MDPFIKFESISSKEEFEATVQMTAVHLKYPGHLSSLEEIQFFSELGWFSESSLPASGGAERFSVFWRADHYKQIPNKAYCAITVEIENLAYQLEKVYRRGEELPPDEFHRLVTELIGQYRDNEKATVLLAFLLRYFNGPEKLERAGLKTRYLKEQSSRPGETHRKNTLIVIADLGNGFKAEVRIALSDRIV